MELESMSVSMALPAIQGSALNTTGSAVDPSASAASGFTLIEVMVFLALAGGITVMVLQDASRTMHSSSIDQMVRDIDRISSTGWNMKNAFIGAASAANGGRLIHQAFIYNPPVMQHSNTFIHPLQGSATVIASSTLIIVSIGQLTQSDCNDTIARLDAWNWAIVRVNGARTTTFKNNTSSPYQGDLSATLTEINRACSAAGSQRILYLERRLQ